MDRIFIVYSFVFTKWLFGAFMMKMLAAERECESLYKQSIGDVRRTDVLVEYSLLPINGDAM